MRILDQHITHSVIKIFIATILIFTFLYVLIDMTSTLDEIIDRKVSFRVLAEYYMNSIPLILAQLTPFACLIAGIFTYSNMNNHNEIIAMRAGGMHFWEIARPAIIFSVLIAAVMLWVNERIVPHATLETKRIEQEHMILEADRHKYQKEVIKNLTFYGLQNRLYFIDEYRPKESRLTGITIIEHDDNLSIKEKVIALEGVWTGIAWKFFNCNITSFEKTFNSPVKIKIYTEKLMDIKETPEDFLTQRVNVNAMNIRQLSNYIRRFEKSGATTALNNLKVDLYQKYAYPLINIVVVLIGLPFALMIQGRKRSTFTCFGIAILIAFAYYVANAVALAFGKGGLIPPFMAAFGTPLLFAATAIYLIQENF